MVDEDLIKKSNLKLIADTMHGSGSKVLPEILKDNLELEAKILNNDRDPLFGGMLPDPSESNLDLMKNEILKNNLDLGVALDGDADRFGVIDGKGIFISPNNVIPMILYHLLKTRKFDHSDIAVRTVATTHLIDEICRKNKIKLLETPVGFKYIGMEMLNNNVIIGGEESGGYGFRGHMPERDGILAGLYFLDLMVKTGKKPSELLAYLYSKVGPHYYKRVDIEFIAQERENIINRIKSNMPDAIDGVKIVKSSAADGFRYVLADTSWLLIRFSGTEPVLRIYTETDSQTRADRMLELGKKLAGV